MPLENTDDASVVTNQNQQDFFLLFTQYDGASAQPNQRGEKKRTPV